jgi:hypothetical protein
LGTKCESCGTYHYDDAVGYCDGCNSGCEYCCENYDTPYGETYQCVKCTGGDPEDLELPEPALEFIKEN